MTLTSSGDGYASTDVLSFEIPASSGVICTTPASIDVATLGITGYSIFTAFGPASKDLRDTFEEHED